LWLPTTRQQQYCVHPIGKRGISRDDARANRFGRTRRASMLQRTRDRRQWRTAGHAGFHDVILQISIARARAAAAMRVHITLY